MRSDPNRREPRAPAIAIWTVTGLLAGLAVAIVSSTFPISVVIGALIGLAFGLYITRVKYTPDDD